MHNFNRHAVPLIALAGLVLLAVPACAGDPRKPSAEEIVKQLSREPEAAGAARSLGLTRSFVPGGRGMSVEAASAPMARPSINLEVNFDYNSAKLTTDAMLTLDQLGKAFNDPALSGAHFQIAGHTDGKGTDAYNQKLSEARAAAVKGYVVTKHHVDGARLDAVGFGKTQLVDPEHPEAAINRRVQVTKVGG